MAITENNYTGNGSTTSYALTFQYIDEDDIKVSLNGTDTTAYTLANATTVLFNTAPANGVAIRIYRDTNIDSLKATFFAGSAIRAQDLNEDFLQNNYAVQELKNNTWDKETSTIHSDEAWVSVDTQVATTAAMDAQFWNQTSETINNAEQIAGSPAPTDSNIFTALAAANRFDTLVQVATPTGTDWEVGKTWLQNDDDKTVSIWNGSAWVPVASGGAFTELPKVVYVDSVNGDDSLAGHRISNPKRTIKAAIDAINADVDGDGSIVVVAPGIYGEEFPIDIQKNDIGIVGQSIRNCIIHPAIGVTPVTSVVIGQTYRIRFIGTTDFIAMGAAGDVNNPPAVGDTFTATAAGTGTGRVESIAIQTAYDVNVPEPNELATMFRVNSGTYLYGLTLQGMKASGARGGNSLDTDATYGLPTNQGWNFSFYPGALIKKSPYIQNCTNFSDSQINNVTFTPHIPGEGAAGDLDSAPTGGGILIDGNTPAANSPLRSMVTDSYTHTALNGPGIFVTNNGYCQATSSYSFFGHYHLKTKNGGQANLAASTTDFGSYSLIADGRSTNPIFTATTTAIANSGSITFTIGAPVAGSPWHGSATRPQDNMLVDIGGNTYPVLSATANGAGWNVTISRPDPNNFNSNLGLINTVNSGSAVSFYLRSMIASSGHTMEYVGSGNDYTALPENGGVPDDTKQVIELNNGKIWAAITDHRGTFKVGNTFKVNQQTGFVTIDASASSAVTKTSSTGSAIIPLGTNAQRDASPSSGYLRFNTTSNSFEGYNGSSWGPLATTSSTVTDGDYGDITVSGSGTIWNIDAGVVGATELASDSVTTAKIATDAVTTVKIADDAVTAAKLADTTVTPGSYGSPTTIPSITVDAQGRITAASNNAFTAGATSLDGLSDAKTLGSGTINESLYIGTDAGNTLTTSSGDVGFGYGALADSTPGGNNVAIGTNASRNSNGVANISIGYNSGRYNSGSFGNNISIGYEAGKGVSGVSTPYHNVNIGFLAGTGLTSGTSNVMLGYVAGSTVSSGALNVYIGHRAGGPSVTPNSTGSSNVAIGGFAGEAISTGSQNAFIGPNAGQNVSTGSTNVAVGSGALSTGICTGTNNIAIGKLPLNACTSGTDNVAIGTEAGRSITTASSNVFIGPIAGRLVTTGSYNIAIGDQALPSATTANRNIAVGYRSMWVATTATYNVAIGWAALGYVTTGGDNVAVGQFAGNSITVGTNNTCIGDTAGDLITTGNNNTCLGNEADPSTATVSNEVVLGNSSVATLRCNTQTISSLSDGRDKIEVEDLPVGLEFINSLRPVKFKWDSRDGNGKDGSYDAGFIAQDLQAAQSTSNAEYLRMVVDANPERLEARYGQLIPVLVQAIKDLKAEIDTLKANA